MQVKTAHFGLTCLRLESLKKVSKPYFLPSPNENGDWTDGKTDDDVHFWQQWEKAGNTLFIDPGTRLGHLEEVVTVFDEQMQLRTFYPEEWKAISASTVD